MCDFVGDLFNFSGGSFRRKYKIDYNQEIPCEKQPPPGFHEDTTDLFSHNFKRMRHQDVIGERRDDIERVRRSNIMCMCVDL